MCIPKPATPAPPAVVDPSLQSAANLALGGSNEATGQQGRQLLKLGGIPGAGTFGPAAAQAALPAAAPLGGLAGIALGSKQQSPLSGIRLGN